jgi:hypothetical protein
MEKPRDPERYSTTNTITTCPKYRGIFCIALKESFASFSWFLVSSNRLSAFCSISLIFLTEVSA